MCQPEAKKQTNNDSSKIKRLVLAEFSRPFSPFSSEEVDVSSLVELPNVLGGALLELVLDGNALDASRGADAFPVRLLYRVARGFLQLLRAPGDAICQLQEATRRDATKIEHGMDESGWGAKWEVGNIMRNAVSVDVMSRAS